MIQLYECSVCKKIFGTWLGLATHFATHSKENVSPLITPIEERLISVLKDGGPLTRDQLVKKMDVPRTTLFDGLKKLIMRNEVKKYPFYETARSRGRPQVLFSLLDDRK